MKLDFPPISIVIPTYRRDAVLTETIAHLIELDPRPAEILVVDQTEIHEEAVERALRNWEAAGVIRLVRLVEPSITRAMNCGLCEARQDFRPFVDDDIVPETGLVQSHWSALECTKAALIAGRVDSAVARRKGFIDAGGLPFRLDACGMDL